MTIEAVASITGKIWCASSPEQTTNLVKIYHHKLKIINITYVGVNLIIL